MDAQQPVPKGVDVERPSSARIYDYYLGGAHNFAADRQVAEQIMGLYPDVAVGAQRNRAFLRRAVQHLVRAGVRQFLDVGSGIPTVGHVHEVARQSAPDVRVAYVDIDPVAVAHSREILQGDPRTTAFLQDLRTPEEIVGHPEVQQLFDLDQPVAVLTVALLHFIPDEARPADLLARLMAPLASGSHLVLSHGTTDGTADLDAGTALYERSGITVAFRDRAGVLALFGDLELVEPGLVWLPQWRPDEPDSGASDDPANDDPAVSSIYAGVARKR